jgi:hypothetical protein
MSFNRTILDLRFACCLILALVSTSAMAALPFDVRGPDFAGPTPILDSVSNTCADYNARVSTTGVSAPGGSSNPGTCGFSTFQILMDGQPAAQYLALVAAGANPPPFKTVFRRSTTGFCAVASGLRVELGASVQPNVSSWPKAGAIGGACGAELGRHPVVDYGGIDAHAFSTLRAIGHFLDVAVSGPNTVQVCLKEKQTPHAEMLAAQQLLAVFANKVQAALNSNPVRFRETQWTLSAGIATNCLLRCNQCGSGWAGTITNTQVIQDSPSPPHPHQFLANEVDTYFVGGAPLVVGNTTSYPADWTTTGGGFNMLGSKTWILNAAVTGACPPVPSDQHVCVKVTTDTMGARSFTQTNDPLSIDNGYTFNMSGTVFPSAAGENQFWSVIPISAAATDTLASGHLVLSAASSCTHPPQASAVTPLICKQTWDWQLFLQQ